MARSTRTDESSNPTPSSDHVSAEADGVRTEAEVVADEQANAERAANEAPPGATGNPAVNAEIEKQAKTDKLVFYVRESDGTVQGVDAGSAEHGILERSGEWSKTTRAKATAADKKASNR
jgi:hypothetical protein